MLKIAHIKQNQIDRVKYDACISTSTNCRIYAFSWYLDLVTTDWEILVLGDYKAVMPLPFVRSKRFFLLKRIIQPNLCQQLGVFFHAENRKNKTDLIHLFFVKFKSLKPKSYSFNAENTLALEDKASFETRINYELNLDNSYKKLYDAFNKNTKRNLKKALKQPLKIVENLTVEHYIDLKENNKKHRITVKDYQYIKKVTEEIIRRKQGQFIGISLNEKTIAIAFIITTDTRIIHLLSASTPQGKQLSAITLLFDDLIKRYSNSKTILDFEGSMIPGIARFFKGFGADENNYLLYRLKNQAT